MSLTLYYHPLASFCHKVLVALYENGCAFEKRIIDLGNEMDRAELQAIWPFCKFPVLRDHVRKRDVAETTVIIEYLDHFFNGARPLIPGDWEGSLEVRHWDRLFDNYVQTPMQQIVSDRLSDAQGALTSERATLETAYGMIDRHMSSAISGGRSPWRNWRLWLSQKLRAERRPACAVHAMQVEHVLGKIGANRNNSDARSPAMQRVRR